MKQYSSYGLVEIKLGGDIHASLRESLNKLAANIDTSKMKQPTFKMILAGTGTCAYKRKDEIIVPIGCLRD